MSRTIELYPRYLDISRDLDETIRLYKEAGFWDNAWDITKGVLYGGSENNQWANVVGWGLMGASMLTPLGAGRLAGSLAMRAAPRLLGRFAARGAGRMAANAATRAGAKGVATAAGKTMANTAGKTMANTAGKAMANTAGKAGGQAVASTAGKASGKALPSTEEWVRMWNEAAASKGGWNATLPAAKNVTQTATQATKAPGMMQQMGQRLGQYGTQMKQFGQQAGQTISPYTAKAKQLYQQAGQKLAPYSAQAGQPMSQWTGKQWAGELAKSFVGASKNNKLNWANFATVYGLGTATGNDEIAHARLSAPFAIAGAKSIPSIFSKKQWASNWQQGLRNTQRKMNRSQYFKANPGTRQEYKEFAQRWRNGGAQTPGTAPAPKPAPQASMSSVPTQTTAPSASPQTGRSWRDQYAYFNPSASGYGGYESPVNFNPAMQWGY